MQTIVSIFSFIVNNWAQILGAVVALLTALIGVFMLVPGPEPEATLQKIVNFLSQFSRKPPGQ